MVTDNMSSYDRTNPEIEQRVCGNCRFFDPLVDIDDPEYGECRFNAPVPYLGGQIMKDSLFSRQFSVTAAWPTVYKENWCSKHVANVIKLEDN